MQKKVLVVSAKYPTWFGKIIDFQVGLMEGEYIDAEKIDSYESIFDKEINKLKVKKEAIEIYKRGL